MPYSTLQLRVHFLSINSAKTLKDRPFTKSLFSPLLTRRRHLRRQVEAKLGISQEEKEGALPEARTRKAIALFDAAPALMKETGGSGIARGGRKPMEMRKREEFDLWFLLKKFPKRVLAALSNLPLAIGEMFTIATLMAIGMLILLAASLMSCTYTNQIPMVKVARRWSFIHSSEAIHKQEFSDSLPRASIQDLGVILMGAGYEVFLKGPTLYAFKGLAGRFAPIGVHIAMLLIMIGATLSASGSFRGSVTVPQGLNFVVADVMSPTGFFSRPTEVFNTEVHVNKFSMDYYESGEVSQFHSDISLFDINGKELMRKTISVNDPLRFGGITIYQTDWGFSALQVSKDGEGPFNLAMAPLQMNGDKKLYGTFLPIGDANSSGIKGISMLARDLQSVFLYDQTGKFSGVRRPSSKLPIDIDGINIVIEDAIGSTGLDLKMDPGVPIVYAGFGALMLTTCMSYLSHSQIWALQDGTTVVLGGKTNRAKLEFPDEMNKLLDKVPELVSADEKVND